MTQGSNHTPGQGAAARAPGRAARGRRGRRGSSAGAVLLVLAAVTALIVIGLDRRTADLELEGRALCRASARSAAESALARGQGALEQGTLPRALQGTLSGSGKSEVRYALDVERSHEAPALIATGTCVLREGARPIEHRVRVGLERRGGRWEATSWREGPR